MRLEPRQARLLFYSILTVMLIICFAFSLNIKKAGKELQKRAAIRETIVKEMHLVTNAEEFRALRQRYRSINDEVSGYARFPALFFILIFFVLLGLGFWAANVMYMFEPGSPRRRKMRFDLSLTAFTIFIFVVTYFEIRTHILSYRPGGFLFYLGPVLAGLNFIAFFLKNLYKPFYRKFRYVRRP